jgi:hypothetical protein
VLHPDVLGWKLDAAADYLKKAGFDLRVTETLAPGGKPAGEQRVARVRRRSDGVVELVVIYSGKSLSDD